MAFTQMVNPGAPVVYGGFTSNVDMKSGAPAFGTPEYMKAAIIGGQLARRYKVPYRSSNVCAANSVDAQAAYEAVFSLWGAVMGGVNMLKHGAGWLEGGLCASFEKFVLDIELLQMVSKFLEPLDVGDAALGLDAVREVGPGGHYFGAAHTQERYRDAFYAPMISDWRNFEAWHDAGEPVAWQRAKRDLQGSAGGQRTAADGSGDFRRTRRFCRQTQGRRRRADGFLMEAGRNQAPMPDTVCFSPNSFTETISRQANFEQDSAARPALYHSRTNQKGVQQRQAVGRASDSTSNCPVCDIFATEALCQ